MTLMASGGCRRIGIGVETLVYQCEHGIKVSRKRLAKLAAWAHRAGLDLKGYIMAGAPDQRECDLLDTYLFCLDQGIEPRVSTYTPFQNLNGLDAQTLDRLDLARWDRKSFLTDDTLLPRTTVIKLLIPTPDIADWVRERFTVITSRNTS